MRVFNEQFKEHGLDIHVLIKLNDFYNFVESVDVVMISKTISTTESFENLGHVIERFKQFDFTQGLIEKQKLIYGI